MINFNNQAKRFTEILDNLLEQDENIEVNSVDVLVKKLNNYGQDQTK